MIANVENPEAMLNLAFFYNGKNKNEINVTYVTYSREISKTVFIRLFLNFDHFIILSFFHVDIKHRRIF